MRTVGDESRPPCQSIRKKEVAGSSKIFHSQDIVEGEVAPRSDAPDAAYWCAACGMVQRMNSHLFHQHRDVTSAKMGDLSM
jgi:hypothetical protein